MSAPLICVSFKVQFIHHNFHTCNILWYFGELIPYRIVRKLSEMTSIIIN